MRVDNGVSKPFPYSLLATKTLKKRTVACTTGGKASDDALASDAVPLPDSQALNLAVVEADKLRKQLAAHNAEFQRLNAHIDQISSAIHHLEEELKQRDAKLAADNAEFQRLNAHIDQISSAYSRVKKQLTETKRHHEIETEQVRERVTQANRLLHSKSISLAESEA